MFPALLATTGQIFTMWTSLVLNSIFHNNKTVRDWTLTLSAWLFLDALDFFGPLCSTFCAFLFAWAKGAGKCAASAETRSPHSGQKIGLGDTPAIVRHGARFRPPVYVALHRAAQNSAQRRQIGKLTFILTQHNSFDKSEKRLILLRFCWKLPSSFYVIIIVWAGVGRSTHYK
jgi:hypothetical protein